MGVTIGTEHGRETRALVAAVTTAGNAPSIHNTQPWHWRIRGDVADLYADPRRHLAATDPDRRLLTLSCGAALHHACVALAAEGIAVEVTRVPEVIGEDHLASIIVTGQTPVTEDALRGFQAIGARHTDRRPLLDESLPDVTVEALRAVGTSFGIGLHVLTRDELLELAAATSWAQEDELRDDTIRGELDAWSGTHRPAGAGVPDDRIPDHAARTTVPSRDFGHIGTLAITNVHDRAGTYAILYGLLDEPHGWLRGGEALSAIWLAATEDHVAVVPLSAPVEWPAARQALIRILSGLGRPYLALRLGTADPRQPALDRTPRLDPSVVLDVIDG